METFQRARKPEHRELRRQAVLDAARELLLELPAADVSLREIARRLGGSKSGIVTYFETREALFLALLQRERASWLDEFEQAEFTQAGGEITEFWARSLAARPVLCELWSMLASTLERNVSAELIREFKLETSEQMQRQARLVARHVPGLTEAAADELVSTSIVVLIGLWPFANPTPAVVEATSDPRLASARVDFVTRYRRALQVLITSLTH
ncbi:TetR family transcriptional regulator [Lentzea sp. NPDC051213]|uniref:TetR/AcrR family transcriptional regulator n=1 Tax=Lentzea sp. NPDC051213 TaxID=3364126 RepID=UPI0037BA39B1